MGDELNGRSDGGQGKEECHPLCFRVFPAVTPKVDVARGVFVGFVGGDAMFVLTHAGAGRKPVRIRGHDKWFGNVEKLPISTKG